MHKNNRWKRFFLPILVGFMGVIFVNGLATEALSVDPELLKSAIEEDITARIQEAIDANVERLQNAAEDRIYQEVRKIIESQVDTKKVQEYVQAKVEQVLAANPTAKRLVDDYKNQQSQQVIGDLQGLYNEATGQLTQIVNSLNAYQEEEEPNLEHFRKLEEIGFKGRWVDKVGEWEAFYEQYGSSVVEDMQTLHGGFTGKEPGGQLLAMFTLMEKYSDKVPMLGQFIKLYAQVGREMLAAAIRSGELIRQREQGCLGEGSHSGIKDWYNLGDPVNVAFTEAFSGQTACPSVYDNIFRNEDDQSVLYFWTGKSFLVGESGNGGTSALAQIMAFLQAADLGSDMDTLHKFYNANFPVLKKQVQTILYQISRHLQRLDNVRMVCGEQVHQRMLRELGLFTSPPRLFEERKSKIFERMIISAVLEDGTAFDTYNEAEIALSQLFAVIIRGKVYQTENTAIIPVADATVKPTVSGGEVYSECQQLVTDEDGRYRMIVLLDQAEVPVLVKAEKGKLESEPRELMLQRTSYYRDGVNLELKSDDSATGVPKEIIISPAAADLFVGETRTFTAMLEYADGSTRNITRAATWSGGSQNSFTGVMPEEATITASFLNLSASADISVKCPDDRPEWNAELGECMSLESAIDSLVEEKLDEYCDEQVMQNDWGQLQQWVAEAVNLEIRFNAKYSKFLKEVNDQNSNVCNNNILAIAFAGSKTDQGQFESLVERVQATATSLILQMGICPDLSLEFGVGQIIQLISQLGPPRQRIRDGFADMQSLLAAYGCDEQETSERGEQVAANTADPNLLDDGGAGGAEICGDGKDNDGDGLIDEGCEGQGNYNVVAYLYDSGSAKDDVFSLSISGIGEQGTTPAGGARTYPLSLSPGSYTAAVTVISAPDNVGTFTLSIKEGDVIIASQSGSPPQGSQVYLSFTVGGAAAQASGPLFKSMLEITPEADVIVFPNEENMSRTDDR